MANLGGELFGDILKVASSVTKKAYGIPVNDSDAPCAKCGQEIKPGEMTTNEGMGGAEQHVRCPQAAAGSGISMPPQVHASEEKTATDLNQVREWMQTNSRDFDNATMLAESAADNFGLYEGDEADIPTEVFDLAHEVMYEDNFAQPVAHTDGEFSDIGGVPRLDVTAASPGLAPSAPPPAMPSIPTFEVGQQVKGRVGASTVTGEVVSLDPAKGTAIVNNGKRDFTVPISTLRDAGEADNAREQGVRNYKEQVKKEEEDAARREKENLIAQSISIPNPQGDWAALAGALRGQEYDLFLQIRPEHLEEAETQYAEWTGGEPLKDECVDVKDYFRFGGWRCRFTDSGNLAPFYPKGVPVIPSTPDGRPSRTPQFISKGDRVAMDYAAGIAELVKNGLRMQRRGKSTEELYTRHASLSLFARAKLSHHSPEEAELPAAVEVNGESTGAKQLPPVETKVPEAEKEAGFNFFFPGQVLKEFYPGLQHEVVDYPNDTNDPMIKDFDIAASLETPKLSYVSTSPAGAAGIGRDGKPQVLEGAPLRKENDIRGGMFMDEFHQQYEGVPGALLTVASKVAAKDEKHQFELFLKKVMAEIAAAFVAAYKVTGRTILNMVPGVGEVQLAQVEQPSSLSSFNIVNTGSRVKYLLDKLNDGDVKEAINKARAQAAVWIDDPNGGFVYEVFARAESIDTDSMIMKYTFIIGTKETE